MSKFYYVTVRDNRTERFLVEATDENDAFETFEGSPTPKADFGRRTINSVYEIVSVEEAPAVNAGGGEIAGRVQQEGNISGNESSVEARLLALLAEDPRALSSAIAGIADQLDAHDAEEIVSGLAHAVSAAPVGVRSGVDLLRAELEGSLRGKRPFLREKPEEGDNEARITCPCCGATNAGGDIEFRSYALHMGTSVENNRVIYRDPETGTRASTGGLLAGCTVCGHEAYIDNPLPGEKY